MKKMIVLTCVFLLMLINSSIQDFVPVAMWGTSVSSIDNDANALERLDSKVFFDRFLNKLATDTTPSTIILFLEESLSKEDFRWRDANKLSLYPNLEKILNFENKKFVSSVDSPYYAFLDLKNDGYLIKSIDEIISSDSPKTVFIANMNDAKKGENRPDMLRRHDEYITTTCASHAKKYDNVICVLTANQSSWVEPEGITYRIRSLLAVDSNDTIMNLYVISGFGMIYTKTPPVLTENGRTEQLVYLGEKVKLDTGSSEKSRMTVSLKSNDTGKIIRVYFDFYPETSNSWILKDVKVIRDALQNKLKTNSIIGTSSGFSFHTPTPVIFKDENSTLQLKFSNLQVELFYNRSRSSFSVPDDTVGFFTPPILSGLFVTGLLTIIVLIGLTMIFDIKTNDQFDDPKGKPLTINASD